MAFYLDEAGLAEVWGKIKAREILPQIIVTAESGSAVTCTNGDIVLTAVAVDGSCTFNVPAYGTWYVSSDVFTETVEVNAVKQYFILIGTQLANYAMLYDYGDECEEITGGWSAVAYQSGSTSYATYSKESDHIYLHSYRALAYTNDAIDFAEYSKIFAKTYTFGRAATGYGAQIFQFASTKEISTANFVDISYSEEFNANLDAAADYCFLFDTPDFEETKKYFGVQSDDNYNKAYLNLYACALMREDDWATLAEIVGVTVPETLDALIADTDAISAILANEAAVTYMTLKCTGDFMASFIASADCLSALEASPYKETVYANEHWAKFLAMVA